MQESYKLEHKQLSARYRRRMAILLAITIIVILISFWIGYYPLSPSQVWKAFLTGLGHTTDVESQAVTIFWKIRLPRILSAMLIGSTLSVSGSVYQGMFQNPLVSPDILGVSAGASLGAACSIFFGFPYWSTQIFAFIGGLTAVLLSYLISRNTVHSQTLSLVLTGTMITALCNSVVTMIKYLSDPNDVLQQITFWLMGSLTKVNMEGVLWSAPPMLIGMVVIILLRWRLNLLSLNDEEAQSLGMNPRRFRLLFIMASTLLSASAVCLGGLIGWVGLMIPHMARAIFGSDYRRLIPGCILLGGSFLLIMDNIARSLLTLELPIGVVTSFLGAPFFVALILKRRK
ncbi:MAG TPA: iron ABC transporter permease [Candidatus Pelethocola excrementipullorum]|nr:iron ABC transporter permease [Candidatus Pelethocola excrementipullorum]